MVPRGRPDQPARDVPRCEPRWLGPDHQQLPPVHDRHRLADAARDRLRHGHHQGRRRLGRHRVLRRRRVQPGRRQRGLHVLGGLQRPRGVLLPEQPVGDLRAHRAPDARAAVPARRRLRLPGRPRRRQRRPGLPGRDPLGPGAGPQRRGPHAGRGLHVPDGRAHHLRRPDPLPGRRGARGLGAQGPDRAPEGPPAGLRPRRRRLLRRAGDRERDPRQAGPRGRTRHARPGHHGHLRERLRGRTRARRRGARPVRRLPRVLRGGN